MPECNVCGNDNQPGSLYCANCGSMLLDRQQVEQSFIDISSLETLNNFRRGKTRESLVIRGDGTAQVVFVIPSSGRRVALELNGPIQVGRADATNEIEPDLDLTVDHGQNHGVSRKHAVVKVGNQGISLVDLGSTNGTVLNNRRLPPNEPYPLNDGDIISFGRLRVQIYLSEELLIRGT
jgi:pSer/pThr/pTyr-binding forkhead associated (FHA) protein